MVKFSMRHALRYVLIVVVLAGLGYAAARAGVALLSPPPATLGVRDGALAPCPPTPNCVATTRTAARPDQLLPPLPLPTDGRAAQPIVLAALRAAPRVTVVTAEADYLHAEFRSAGMGFIDDVEFYIDRAAGLLHFRSAARLGSGDMGVNRARMIALSEQLQRALAGD